MQRGEEIRETDTFSPSSPSTLLSRVKLGAAADRQLSNLERGTKKKLQLLLWYLAELSDVFPVLLLCRVSRDFSPIFLCNDSLRENTSGILEFSFSPLHFQGQFSCSNAAAIPKGQSRKCEIMKPLQSFCFLKKVETR